MELRGMVLSCIDTMEEILSDWRDTFYFPLEVTFQIRNEAGAGRVNLTDSGPFSTIMPFVNIAYHIIPRTTTSLIGAVFV